MSIRTKPMAVKVPLVSAYIRAVDKGIGRVRRPLLLDRFFEVVPLDEHHPEALRRSPMGEAVFPEGDDVFRPRESPHEGDDVVISSVASQRLSLLDSEAFAEILQELFRSQRDPEQENS